MVCLKIHISHKRFVTTEIWIVCIGVKFTEEYVIRSTLCKQTKHMNALRVAGDLNKSPVSQYLPCKTFYLHHLCLIFSMSCEKHAYLLIHWREHAELVAGFPNRPASFMSKGAWSRTRSDGFSGACCRLKQAKWTREKQLWSCCCDSKLLRVVNSGRR